MSGIWGTRCVEQLPTPEPGLVDAAGNSMEIFDESLTWGIDVPTCERFCNHNIIPLTFQFQSFSNAFTNFLLPWLGLIAQLPYETGDPLSSVTSACLSLGSPALGAYSLAITILNRLWVRRQFNKLYNRARDGNVRKRYPELAERVRNVQYLLQEAQQVPMRASQKDGWLSSLIVSRRNQGWWERLQINLSKTRRGVTLSFIFQITTAIVAWILTIIASFVGTLGEVSTSLQVSGGALWLWMVPVLIGWILVGTQSRHNSIEDSMEGEGSHRALAPQIQDGKYTEESSQQGIVCETGLSPQPHRSQTIQGAFETTSKKRIEVPNIVLLDIAGDEGQPGPVYNYARVFTWWQFAHIIEQALSTTIENIASGKACKKTRISPGSEPSAPREHDAWVEGEGEGSTAESNLEGDCRDTASYCGLETGQIPAYPSFDKISPEVVKRMLMASIVAIWVQWGTTGPSIMIAYLTPTVGLGCRSGSYLLYGCLSTLIWLAMVASMLLSHAAMLEYQKVYSGNTSIDLQENKDEPPKHHKRTPKHTLIAGTAVLTRFIAKLLALFNATWLVVASLMEMVGGFDNCWCKANKLVLGDQGWVVLFKSADELAQASTLPLACGVATSIIVCLISIAFFYFCSSNNENQ